MKKLLILFLAPICAFATNYYVTQSGTGNGTNSSSPWSLAKYNASSLPTGGDTVYFSGTFTSQITVATSGKGNGASRLVLDFSAATLNSATNRIFPNGNNYITLDGGGSWNNGVFTPGCILGNLDGCTGVDFKRTQSHDVTIQGFQHTASTNADAYFISGQYCYNLLVTENNMQNVASFYWTDGVSSHDLTFSNNFCSTNQNTTFQTDIIGAGDSYNVIIEGNKLVQRAVGNTVLRHNDIIQCYRSGSGGSGAPYGWIIRYNWLELDVVGGTGDTSQMMMEAMSNNGSTPALKVYGNVFFGTANDSGSNNGVNVSGNSGTYYFCNNTIIRRNGPANVATFSAPGTLIAKNNVGWSPSLGWDGLKWTMTNGGWSNNCFYNWETPGSTQIGLLGSLSVDPLFTNAGSNVFSLQSTSKLRGGADSTVGAEFNQGIAPNATWPKPALISRGSSWDVGAYQYASTSTPPQTTTDTPPSNAKISITTP